MRSSLLLVASLAALPSCSDGDTTGTGTSTGGEPSTAPEGSVNVEIYATPEQSCPTGNIHIDIGNSRNTPPDLEVDGQAGATVSCTVGPDAADGTLYNASATLKKGAFELSFKDVKTDGKSAVGAVSFVDPKGSGRYTSSMKSPCVFQFAPNSGQTIGDGMAWMQFDCSTLVSEQDPTKSCSSRYGYILVDRCAKK